MQNEPNFRKSQMFITAVSTRSYNEKCTLDTWSKRTQTNPILPAIAGKIALSGVEGSVVSEPVLSIVERVKSIYGELTRCMAKLAQAGFVLG